MKLPDISRQNTTTNASKRGNASSSSQGNIGIARVAKIIELVGTSDESWEAAAQVAIEEARKTIHNIHRVKIKEQTAGVDPATGRIVEYRSSIYLSLGVDDKAR